MASNAAKERFEKLQNLCRAGRHDEAESAVTAALCVTPKDVNMLHLAATIAEAKRDVARAVMFLRRALTQKPDWAEAQFNLARLLGSLGEYAEAVSLMNRVTLAHPQMTSAFVGLAQFHHLAGNLPAAQTTWARALALVPNHPDYRAQYYLISCQLCDWSVQPDNLDQLPPAITTVLADDPVLQQQAARRTATEKFGSITPLPPRGAVKHSRLRIGYLSSDFHAHATSYLMAELFALHNREMFEVFVYSYGVDDNSDIRARIKNEAEHFIVLNNLTAQEVARRIRGDEIDILIDLKGYTRGGRLEIFAYKSAPVQMHWLGYPGTLGTKFIDYFVGDDVTLPPGVEQNLDEKLLRLPHSYQINDRRRKIGTPLSRAEYGLPDNAFVFASFNQTYKITLEIFALWCDLLREIPDSVLWLHESNKYAPDNLRAAAQKHDIAPERLIFAAPTPLEQHLARYAHVDLALDTFPVGGHTTTSDALWAGTPVISMAGKSFITRVAASVLGAAGLSDLVVSNMEDYRKLALSLAKDKTAREDIRRHLSENRNNLPLFDTPRFVRDWEAKLHEISQNHGLM